MKCILRRDEIQWVVETSLSLWGTETVLLESRIEKDYDTYLGKQKLKSQPFNRRFFPMTEHAEICLFSMPVCIFFFSFNLFSQVII